MKKILLASLLFSVIFFVSCQKEIDWGLGGSGGSTMLVKIVQKSGTDSVTINYSYDASKRLIEEKTTGMSSGTDVGNDLRIVRNSSGIITQTVQTAAALAASGIDSVVTRYNYDAVASRYTSSVFQILLFGFGVSDSAVYSYDASGNISKGEHYQAITGFSPYALALKQDYTYSAAGNIASQKQSSYDVTTSSYTLVATLNYTYDSKVNPLKLSREGILLTRPGYYGANNTLESQYIDATDPTKNITTDMVYTYDLYNRPLTATSTQTPSGTVSAVTYYYQ